METLTLFKCGESLVRSFDNDGEIYFVGSDVAGVLGYSNHSDAISRHCKGVVKRDLPTNGGVQSFSLIPERDVYRLIMRSKLPSAEKFEDWVVGEVLPSIRKTGNYSIEPKFQIPQTLGDALQLAADQAKQLEQQAPKVEYFDKVLDSKNGFTATEIASELGMSARALNSKLKEMSVQRKIGRRWVLVASLLGNDYTTERTYLDDGGTSRHSMLWTEKGCQFVHELF